MLKVAAVIGVVADAFILVMVKVPLRITALLFQFNTISKDFLARSVLSIIMISVYLLMQPGRNLILKWSLCVAIEMTFEVHSKSFFLMNDDISKLK